jgi:pseudouridine kinase
MKAKNSASKRLAPSTFEGLKSNGKVLVIGSACVDIIGRLKEDLVPLTSNPALIRTTFGGVARNVAENLARLGQPVTLLTVAGEDQEGDQLLQQVASAGVNVEFVLRTADHPTCTYLAVLNASGQMQFALDDMRAISVLTAARLRELSDLFEQAEVVFLDANLSIEALRTALALARKARLPVCADPASASLAVRLQPYLARFTLITPNAAEACVLGGCTFQESNRRQALQVAKKLVSQGVEIAILTLGEHGVCYASSETSGYLPAIRTEVLDSTGAGAAMTAAVIFALLNEIPLDEAVRLGVSAAALTLNTRGAVMPDLSLEKLYDRLVI